jgi:CDP-diacylglycerol--serine O-phosphatidyltransferase
MPFSRRRKPRPGLKQRRFRQRLIAYREAKGRPALRRIPRAAVPSFFTLMNLFCGFLAIIQVHEGMLVNAAWLILLASFFDMLDGMMARLTNSTSLFGVELDSLCDVVSFGVAPSFMIWAFGLRDFGTAGVIVASLPALAGAIRLARFNVNFEGTKSEYFSGLPIPMSAMVIVALILNDDLVRSWMDGKGDINAVMGAVIFLSVLMVTNIPFDSVPQPSARYIRTHPQKVVLALLAVALLFWLREFGLLLVLGGYLLIGISRAVIRLARAIREAPEPGTSAGG